jgi:hypothetical protein
MSDDAEIIQRYEKAQDRIHNAAETTAKKLRKRRTNTELLIRKHRRIAEYEEEKNSILLTEAQKRAIEAKITRIAFETKRRALRKIETRLLQSAPRTSDTREFLLANEDRFLEDIDCRIRSTFAHLDLIKHPGNTNALGAKYYLAQITAHAMPGDPEIEQCLRDAEAAFAAEIRRIQLDCVICLDADKFTAGLTLHCCRSTFHRECLMPWLNWGNTCPLCRARLTVDDLF